MSTLEARRQCVSKAVGWPEIVYPDAYLAQMPAVERRSAGKRGSQDGETVLAPPHPADLGNHPKLDFTRIPAARRLREYIDISTGRKPMSFLLSANTWREYPGGCLLKQM